jgi:hypothetical protein
MIDFATLAIKTEPLEIRYLGLYNPNPI